MDILWLECHGLDDGNDYAKIVAALKTMED